MSVKILKPVHGIKDDGYSTVNKLGKRIADLSEGTVISSPFARPKIWGSRKRGIITGNIEPFVYKDAKALLADSPKGTSILAHSQGGQIASIASLFRGAQFDTLILLMPALRRDFTFSTTGFNKLLVVHNIFDSAIFLARFLKKFSDWGEMGRYGSDWLDHHPEKGMNIAAPYEAKGNDHSFIFENEQIDMWAQDLLERL